MAVIAPDTLVVAEMNTHDYIWRGAGATCDEAREALLGAWSRHRAEVVARHPTLAPTLPASSAMPQHFAIRYRAYVRGAGYRDEDRLL